MSQFDENLRDLMGYQLHRATHMAMARFRDAFGAFGLRRTTFSCLSLIVDQPGLRQSQIAQALDIERPNLVQFLDELEKRELVVREVAAGDRRAYALQPTAKGIALAREAMAAARQVDETITASLTEVQVNELRRLLREIERCATDDGSEDGV